MDHPHRNPSNKDHVGDTHRTVGDADNGTTIIDVSPPSIALLHAATVGVRHPTQESRRELGTLLPSRLHPTPPAVGHTLSKNQGSSHISVVTAKLQSENQRIKTEIYETVHGITQVRVPDEEVSSTDWCWILSACVETQILQTNHEELWDRHLNSPCEITADIYAEMVRKHGDLRRLYEQALKSHAALQDGYNRFARQLTIPCSPNDPPLLNHLEDDDSSVVKSDIILDAFRHRRRTQVRSAEKTTVCGSSSEATTSVIHASHPTSNPRKRRTEWIPLADSMGHPGEYPSTSTSSIPCLPKRRRVVVSDIQPEAD